MAVHAFQATAVGFQFDPGFAGRAAKQFEEFRINAHCNFPMDNIVCDRARRHSSVGSIEVSNSCKGEIRAFAKSIMDWRWLTKT